MNTTHQSIAKLIVLTSIGGSIGGIIPAPANAIPTWTKYCGPASNPTLSISWNTLLYPWSALFDSACKTHDENYDLVNNQNNNTRMTQTRADRIFKDEMNRLCDTRWRDALRLNGTVGDFGYGLAQIFSLGSFAPAMKAWCKSSALANYSMVAEFGADIGAATGFPSVKVTRARVYREDDYLSDDEIKVQFTVVNDGNVDIEVDAVMMKKGRGYRHLLNPGILSRVASALNSNIADTEPDTYEVDLASGRSWSDSVDTNGSWASQEDLDNPVNIFIRTDEWSKSGLLSNFSAPFTPKAWIQCPKPRPDKWGSCTVKYRVGDTWKPITVSESARKVALGFRRLRLTTPQDNRENVTSSNAAHCATGRHLGRYALRSQKTGKFVRAGIGSQSVMGAVSSRVGGNRSWETFDIYDLGNRNGLNGGTYALRSTQDPNRWVSVIDNRQKLRLLSGCTTATRSRLFNVNHLSSTLQLQSLQNRQWVILRSDNYLYANARGLGGNVPRALQFTMVRQRSGQ
jgi:hypothetical protein